MECCSHCAWNQKVEREIVTHEHGHMSPSVGAPASKSWGGGGPLLSCPDCEMRRRRLLSLPSVNTQGLSGPAVQRLPQGPRRRAGQGRWEAGGLETGAVGL